MKTAGVPSARLDAELLLAHFLEKPREYLFAHPETILRKGPILTQLNAWLERRVKREPMAYILGGKEFYGRTFRVTPDVLVPRPESETMIELLKELVDSEQLTADSSVADIGTGSGCLAITSKLELSQLEIIAIDNSQKALEIAKENAQTHHAEIKYLKGNLLEPLLTVNCQLSAILANLPYVDEGWDVSPETRFEPREALFSAEKGLELIKRLITQTTAKLQKNGFLLLEADPRQHKEIIAFAKNYQLRLHKTEDFIQVFSYS